MDERNNDFDFDFTPIGLAIKKARTAQGMTREQLARIVDYDPRHLQAIENEGQKITPTFSVSVTVAILISDTKCGIERNDFFVVLKAEVFGRELDSISGLVGVHIDL